MSWNDSKPPTSRILSAVALLKYCGVTPLLLLLLIPNITTRTTTTTVLAWVHSTKPIQQHNTVATMRSSNGNTGANRDAFGHSQRTIVLANTAPNRPDSASLPLSSSSLFLSSRQEAAQSSSNNSDNDNDNENSIDNDNDNAKPSDNSPPIFLDATLIGDYLVEMMMCVDGSAETFSWRLHSIKDVVAAATRSKSNDSDNNDDNNDDGIIWKDGTEATEALSFGMSSSSSSLSRCKPRAEVVCRPSATDESNGNSYSFDSKANFAADDTTNTNPGENEKDLLSLLQILQAQWVAHMLPTKANSKTRAKTNHELDDDDQDDSPWRIISRDALVSKEGLAGLFQESGLLLDAGNVDALSSMEWVEMMTGTSMVVGSLPRSMVHKFNILHRGIGAFITKDKPIDPSSMLLSSKPNVSMPDLYVHRRVAEKRIFPSLYDMFVGGVSIEGEDSELTAQREIAEELGLSKALSTSLGTPFLRCLICTSYNRCLVDLFQYCVDTTRESISWQEEEVAWGDFVDYQIIQASADLSMQRAASEGTWPGSYPPIQSEWKGILPKEHDDGCADVNGEWKEWDYVPDGLLVWKAWLEMIETGKINQQQQQQQQQTTNEQPALSFEVEFGVEGGKNEIVTVELSSMKDIVPQSQQLATRFNADINDIQNMLKQMWAGATHVPVYDGPSLTIIESADDDDAECTIKLPLGLVLELRPSTIGETAGLGLFVRKASSDVGDVLQTQGSAFCGYGPCDQITDSLVGLSKYQRQRSFEFVLSDGLESYVWHKGNLLTVGDVIRSTGATAVKAHKLLVEKPDVEVGKTSSSPLPGLSLAHDSEGRPCYLVPPAECPDPKSLTIQTIGHMCNDLAGGISRQTEEEYDASSDRNNLLVLVPSVAVDADGVLQPTGMPILTLAKSVHVGNVVESMEVGLRYGGSYWKNGFS